MELSIIIPTYNRQETLKQSISHAISAIKEKDIEIIIVNDGDEILDKIEYPNIQYYKNPDKGVTSARNFGASLAKSDLLLFIDDDIWINKETVDSIKYIRETIDVNNSICCLNWEYPKELTNALLETKIGRFFLNNNYNTMEGRFHVEFEQNKKFIKSNGIGSATLLVSKYIFNKIGGYNEDILFQGEDVVLYNDLKNNNIQTLIYTPVTCFHNDRMVKDLKSYLIRQYNGFISQASAEKINLFNTLYENRHSIKEKIYKALVPVESLLIFIYNIIPNNNFFDIVSFKLIGILSSLQRIKAYRKIYSK